MDKNLRAKWLNELRNTKTVQCLGFLRQNDERDALGILLDLSDLGSWHQTDQNPYYDENCWFYEDGPLTLEYPPSYTVPNSRLRNKLGLTLAEQEMVMAMNDSGRGFAEIADQVSKYIL